MQVGLEGQHDFFSRNFAHCASLFFYWRESFREVSVRLLLKLFIASPVANPPPLDCLVLCAVPWLRHSFSEDRASRGQPNATMGPLKNRDP
jgi:hypothetical protein